MNVNKALIEEVKKALADNKSYKKKVESYLENNRYRVLEELTPSNCLDILAMIDPDIFMQVKKNMETLQIKEDIEYAIDHVFNFLEENKDDFVTFAKYREGDYNAIFLISKKIRITVSHANNNNPFHSYETKEEKTYWSNFIIRCQFNESINLIAEDKIFTNLLNNNCPVFNVSNKYRANQVLEGFS